MNMDNRWKKKTDRLKPVLETNNYHHKPKEVERRPSGETDEQRPEERAIMFSTCARVYKQRMIKRFECISLIIYWSKKNNKISNARTNVTLRRVRITIAVLQSLCVSVALVVQHATRLHCAILPSVACPALPYFSTLSHKRHDFRGGKKKFNIKLCFSLRLLSETFS